jgi:hypothetical protein
MTPRSEEGLVRTIFVMTKTLRPRFLWQVSFSALSFDSDLSDDRLPLTLKRLED